MNEVTFNQYLLMKTPDIIDQRAICLGQLGIGESHILAIGDKHGKLQLFLAASQKPWFETDLKGTIVAIKIASLFNNNEVLMIL